MHLPMHLPMLRLPMIDCAAGLGQRARSMHQAARMVRYASGRPMALQQSPGRQQARAVAVVQRPCLARMRRCCRPMVLLLCGPELGMISVCCTCCSLNTLPQMQSQMRSGVLFQSHFACAFDPFSLDASSTARQRQLQHCWHRDAVLSDAALVYRGYCLLLTCRYIKGTRSAPLQLL